MKLSTIILAAIFGLYSYNPEGNAKAKRVQGIDVSEPLQDYEVVDSGKVQITLTGLHSINHTINYIN